MWKRRASVAFGVLALIACGSRTGLLVDETFEEETDAGGIDARADVPFDVRPDVHDAGPDARPDVTDALPPLDVTPRPDVQKNDCPDAASTLIYVVTETNELFSFYPPDNAFKQIGLIACPAIGGATPFSMAVDRKGIARVVFNDGELFRVSTLNASCVATPYVPGQDNITTFGMSYTSDDFGGGETLYIASGPPQAGNNPSPSELGKIDQNYFLHVIGQLPAQVSGMELTGNGSGGLFGFWATDNTARDSFISQVDKNSGQIVGQTRLSGVSQGLGWAFAFWGGDFYIFVGPNGTTDVWRFRPSDNSLQIVTRLNSLVVGAGVSTCAPEQ